MDSYFFGDFGWRELCVCGEDHGNSKAGLEEYCYESSFLLAIRAI
jgi:hypothetical protein